MAGRILPIALATVAGVSIGVATFGEEFKEQRRRRLQEEYDGEVAAQAALKGQNIKHVASDAIPPRPPQQIPAQQLVEDETKASASESDSSWSSMLGLWAWRKHQKRDAAPETLERASTQSTAAGPSGKPSGST